MTEAGAGVAFDESSAADERERIARELQDVVSTRLDALGKRLDAIMPLTGEPDVQRRIGESVAELSAIIADVRARILELRRGDGDPHSVEAVIKALALNAGQQLGCTPRLEFSGALDSLEPSLVPELTSVADEALTNLVRHAYAGTIDVSLVLADGTLTLEVRDDGVGPNDEPTGGKGLSDMLARAEALGGTFTIEPNEPLGTRVRWSVPAIP
ncbi:MAG: sensor histidine kinase [Sciscionella sp.]